MCAIQHNFMSCNRLKSPSIRRSRMEYAGGASKPPAYQVWYPETGATIPVLEEPPIQRYRGKTFLYIPGEPSA